MNLTKRETEVLDWAQKGLSNKQIAQRIGITESTVKIHITSLLKKYGVRTRVQLALYSTQGQGAPVLPELEAQPYAWIKHNGIFSGISFAKCPDETWIPLYRKQGK